MKLIKKGRITSKDVDNLANVLFDLDSVVGLKKKMEKLSERSTALVYEIRDTSTNALLVSLPKTMLEDL
jgi:cell division protein FtsB